MKNAAMAWLEIVTKIKLTPKGSVVSWSSMEVTTILSIPIPVISIVWSCITPLVRADPSESIPGIVMVFLHVSDQFPGHQLLKKSLRRDFWTAADLVKKWLRVRLATGDSLWRFTVGVMVMHLFSTLGIVFASLKYIRIGCAVLSTASCLLAWLGPRGVKATWCLMTLIAVQSLQVAIMVTLGVL